jgi:hypothetical protein
VFFEEKKKRSGMSCLLAGVWQLKGMRRNTDKEICALYLGMEDVKHISLDCLYTRNWRTQCLNEKWLNMKKEIVYRKKLRCTNKDQIRNLDRYLDRVK